MRLFASDSCRIARPGKVRMASVDAVIRAARCEIGQLRRDLSTPADLNERLIDDAGSIAENADENMRIGEIGIQPHLPVTQMRCCRVATPDRARIIVREQVATMEVRWRGAAAEQYQFQLPRREAAECLARECGYLDCRSGRFGRDQPEQIRQKGQCAIVRSGNSKNSLGRHRRKPRRFEKLLQPIQNADERVGQHKGAFGRQH
ncbi:hypothetical protein SAMN05444161_7250 [Rhizobiales bacterium GAS191]|nr:hypothetical protein SAMN05444161_7250 [Rhizobiales bacterium GAS191]